MGAASVLFSLAIAAAALAAHALGQAILDSLVAFVGGIVLLGR
jgi:hypothetical protein